MDEGLRVDEGLCVDGLWMDGRATGREAARGRANDPAVGVVIDR
jgi:hypothetical protein